MTAQFEALKSAYTITVGDLLLPAQGGYGIGAVAAVMPDEKRALLWVAEYADDLTSLDRGSPSVIRVGDPWKFMRRAASEGLVGIEGADNLVFPDRFMFMVRVEEAGATLPTVLGSINPTGRVDFLTRTGVQHVDHAEVLHWKRFDVSDRVAGLGNLSCPFQTWQQGGLLYELCSDHAVVLLANVALLGDWNSPDGAFAFFLSAEGAEHYLRAHLGDGRNKMAFTSAGGPKTAAGAMASLGVRPVRDLRSRLAQLCDVRPEAAWCVNPDGHRGNSGFGRMCERGRLPIAFFTDPNEAIHMTTVAGRWRLLPNNVFDLDQADPPWSGSDTVRWSGSQSLQLLPLDRSFVVDPGVAQLEIEDGLTETDAEEVIARYLDSVELMESSARLEAPAVADIGLDEFVVVAWDSVTGDRAECPWRFPGPLAAMQHLIAYERERDRHYRAEGALSCSHIGFSGSGDHQFEGLRGARFRLGLRRLALRTIRRRYRPQDAEDLVTLCNGTLRTLHVDYAGFAKDLLWASSSDQEAALFWTLGIDEQSWHDWAKSADSSVDVAGKSLVVERIGDAAWDRLLPQVRHFLATALLHLNEQGHAPQLDYAPISIEVVKALEVELVEVLDGFRNAQNGVVPNYDKEDKTDEILAGFLRGKKLTLGNMPFLLSRPKSGASDLRLSMHAFVTALPNSAFLTSKPFLKRLDQDVIKRFRNGGAHDSPISEGVCRECVEALIGTHEAPGFVPQVVAWRG